ncbi:MAG TPA: dephospho-CoA kinase [Terriglobales bacterium]|nr:dephospho-CoA kinase [Terriglobales bacterium]
MLKVGLTGGIASGKSVVGEMFARLGAHVIQADLIAHQLMQPGEAVYDEVLRHFGRSILNPDGIINRPKLAAAAFEPAEGGSRVEELNRIVHPAVIDRQDEWMRDIGERDPEAVAMVEAALILEAGAKNRFDRLVVVTCHPEQRIERWARRTHADELSARHEVTRRMAAQIRDEEKVKAADYVIDNSGSLDDTERQVRTVFAALKECAALKGSGPKTNQEPRTKNQ